MMMISVMWWMHCKLYKPVISCLLFTSKISQSQDWWWSLIPPQPVILSDSLQFSISLHLNILSPVWYWQRHPPTSKWLLNNMDASLYLKVWKQSRPSHPCVFVCHFFLEHCFSEKMAAEYLERIMEIVWNDSEEGNWPLHVSMLWPRLCASWHFTQQWQ